MGSIVDLNLKCGIGINGKDALDYNPTDVAGLINSDETGLLRAIFENALMDNEDENGDERFPISDDYAKQAGRPSLKKVPYMKSENDGLPFLPGHDPLCDGKPYAFAGGKRKVCKCKYDKWNYASGSPREVWPGMDIDDFDM